jgi:hypothetical protein
MALKTQDAFAYLPSVDAEPACGTAYPPIKQLFKIYADL